MARIQIILENDPPTEPTAREAVTPAQSELAYTATTVATRCAGLTDAQRAHLDDDPLPPEIYSAAEIALVRYVRESTLRLVVADALYGELQKHFDSRQIVDLCLIVGLRRSRRLRAARFPLELPARPS